ncbi:MAG: hypothetical protein OXD46_10955 [Chloroflexi bacterium]|nr:hypothetical protein [Chloroflexota bacterium]
MMLFFRFIWPRSWKSFSVWIPLIAVGLISCVGLSLAMGFRSGLLAQHETATIRDGPNSFSPEFRMPGDPPLRSSRPVATGYGVMNIAVYWGEEGQRLDVPGIPAIRESGTALVTPAVLAQFDDDWTGELRGWLGDRAVEPLPEVAVAHPREMAIVEFTDTVSPELASKSSFQPIRTGEGWPDESGFIVIFGLLILTLPSVALARAGAAIHLNARSRRFGLLRIMGAQPRQLALLIAADMAIPTLAGALLGSVIYAAVMSSLRTFTLVGNSYWASDLVLPLSMSLALPFVVVLVGLVSAIRMVFRAGRDPVGTLRRERKHTSYLAYLSSAGVVAGPAAMFAASEVDFTLAPWLITAGLLLSVVGLEGLSRVAVAAAGRLLADWSRAQVAGWRMYQGGAEAVLGVSATSVAVFLVIFTVYSNFENRPPATGDFHLKAEFIDVIPSEQLVRDVVGYEGVTRIVKIGETRGVSFGEFEGGLYTMTCEDVPGSVKLEGPCMVGNIYPVRRLTDADSVDVWIDPNRYPTDLDSSDSGTDVASALSGTYPVGGRVIASWLPATSNFQAVLILDEPLGATKTILLITTDGEPSSLRGVIEGLEARPEETWVTTKWAIEAGVEVGSPDDELVVFPYLFVMAMTAAGMAAVALLYAIMLLFRQRQAEFRALRSFGATRMLLAVDLGLLFAIPLVLAFGLAVASGIILAASYNTAFGVPASPGNPQAIAALAFVLAVGIAATALVAGRATRIPPLVSDPDATTS